MAPRPVNAMCRSGERLIDLVADDGAFDDATAKGPLPRHDEGPGFPHRPQWCWNVLLTWSVARWVTSGFMASAWAWVSVPALTWASSSFRPSVTRASTTVWTGTLWAAATSATVLPVASAASRSASLIPIALATTDVSVTAST